MLVLTAVRVSITDDVVFVVIDAKMGAGGVVDSVTRIHWLVIPLVLI